MPDGNNQLVDFFTLLRKLLLAGFPLYSEPSFGTMRTVMSETEKSKGFRFLLTSPFAVVFRVSSEFNQAALILFQFQAEVSPEEFIKDLRKEPIDKAVETVKKHIRVFGCGAGSYQ